MASLSFAEPGGTWPVSGLTVRADPVGEVTVIGPGAGPELAGQGVLSDLISVARTARR